MATHTGRVRLAARTHDQASTRRLGGILEPALAVLAVLALGAGTIAVRTPGPSTTTVSVADITGGAPAGTPVELTAAAADLLEATTRDGGTGYRFEIVQRSTLVAREGGPLLDIPDPADPTKSLGARAHGIGEDLLRWGNENFGGVQGPDDNFAVEIGFRLWRQSGHALTRTDLRLAVLKSMPVFRQWPDTRAVNIPLRP